MLLADDVRNTGETFARCAALVQEAGGTVRRDRRDLRPHAKRSVDLGVPNIALAEYSAPENYKAGDCPLCKAGDRHHAVLKSQTSESLSLSQSFTSWP